VRRSRRSLDFQGVCDQFKAFVILVLADLASESVAIFRVIRSPKDRPADE